MTVPFFDYLIDWLTIRQPNDGRYPALNDGYFIRVDGDGVVEYETAASAAVEGSFDTSARLRVTHDWLDLSFNPSRFCRRDNVFGVRFDDALRVADGVLRMAGLPPLVRNGENRFHLTRVDVTANFAAGSRGCASAALRGFAMGRMSRMRTVRRSHSVLYTNKSWSFIVYDKATEMREHPSPWLHERPYRERVVEWLSENGVLRFEMRLNRRFLRTAGLMDPECVDDCVLRDLFVEKCKEVMKMRPDDDTDGLSTNELGLLLAWQRGYDTKSLVCRNTWFKHRRAILEKTGFDISGDAPVRLEPRRERVSFREVIPPDWYELPRVKSDYA